MIAMRIIALCVGGEMFISEQINRTRAKSQQIVVQDYSHAYNTPFCS